MTVNNKNGKGKAGGVVIPPPTISSPEEPPRWFSKAKPRKSNQETDKPKDWDDHPVWKAIKLFCYGLSVGFAIGFFVHERILPTIWAKPETVTIYETNSVPVIITNTVYETMVITQSVAVVQKDTEEVMLWREQVVERIKEDRRKQFDNVHKLYLDLCRAQMEKVFTPLAIAQMGVDGDYELYLYMYSARINELARGANLLIVQESDRMISMIQTSMPHKIDAKLSTDAIDVLEKLKKSYIAWEPKDDEKKGFEAFLIYNKVKVSKSQ